MNKKLHIKKGDSVKVLSGVDKGKEGKVLIVQKDSNRAIVEGINMVSRHTKPSAKHTQGGIIKQEAAIHVSNLMVIDPKDGVAKRVGRVRNEKGRLERYFKERENKAENE